MFRFFRLIRQKLLESGNLSRYTFYAFGEIVLVVIGILFALQINNANQNRIGNKKEKLLLHELKEDLESNIKEFYGNIYWEENRIIGMKKILDYASEGKSWNDTLAGEVARQRLMEEFLINSTTFETFKSIGFDLISTDSLRRAIIDLFEVKYHMRSHRINNYAIEGYSSRELFFQTYFQYDLEKNGLYPFDPENILQNQEFIGIISGRAHPKSYFIRFNKNAISESQEVIDLLNKELGIFSE